MNVLLPVERLSDGAFYDLCAANPDVWFERTAEGEIVIAPPPGGEADSRNTDLVGQLWVWAKRNRQGRLFGPTCHFILPGGAIRSPDAAWVSNARLAKLTKEKRRKFLPVVPEFVVEVMPPSDRLKPARSKMDEWMVNGVDLAWLIDGDRKAVYVYRAGQEEPEKRTGIIELAGEGPVNGFVLNLEDIWEGL